MSPGKGHELIAGCQGAAEEIPEVASIMAKELDFDETWIPAAG